MPLQIEDWGLIDYEQALKRQEQYVEEIYSGDRGNTLVFCSHDPIVTLGRATQEGDVFGWAGPILQVSRGGRATYHGPSQLIFYPIYSLKEARNNSGPHDVVGFLRRLEEAMVKCFAEYGLSASGKSHLVGDETGVWIENRKVASLGIAVRHWISFHGAAINVEYDPKAFTGMNPCGLHSSVMISLEQLLDRPVDRQELKSKLINHLENVLIQAK